MTSNGQPFAGEGDLAQLARLRQVLRHLDPAGPPAAILTGGSLPAGARRVGILPGSFNPPTEAHWHLAVAGLETGELDAAAFLLSVRTVDKEEVTGLGLDDRLLVLAKLAAERPGLAVIVTNRGLYVDQAEALRSILPTTADIIFLVGFDKILQIFDPKYYDDRDAALERLFALARILVAPRAGQTDRDLAALLERPENRRFGNCVAPLAVPVGSLDPDLSATQVRRALATGDVPAGVPPPVARFLANTGAFAPATVLPDGERIERYVLRRRLIERLAPDAEQPASDARFQELWTQALEPTEPGRALREDLRRLG